MLGYIGSGPYCYTNSLSMMLGGESPTTAVIETLTGSPFGAQLIGGSLPLFDPYGWDPETGLDAAIALLGWTCERSDGGTCGRGTGPAADRLLARAGPGRAGGHGPAAVPARHTERRRR